MPEFILQEPEARFGRLEPRLLEQTARQSPTRCAEVQLGRISYSRTRRRYAARQPPRSPPARQSPQLSRHDFTDCVRRRRETFIGSICQAHGAASKFIMQWNTRMSRNCHWFFSDCVRYGMMRRKFSASRNSSEANRTVEIITTNGTQELSREEIVIHPRICTRDILITRPQHGAWRILADFKNNLPRQQWPTQANADQMTCPLTVDKHYPAWETRRPRGRADRQSRRASGQDVGARFVLLRRHRDARFIPGFSVHLTIEQFAAASRLWSVVGRRRSWHLRWQAVRPPYHWQLSIPLLIASSIMFKKIAGGCYSTGRESRTWSTRPRVRGH
jgi:hypothetical protein